MIYKCIKLENFRNYEKRTFTFHDKVNFFLGENGRGKTNLLESLYLTSYGKSFRTFRDREMIKFDEEYCRVTGIFARGNEESQTVEIYIGRDGTRKGNVDGIEFQKYSDIFDHVLAVVFSPEDLKIIKESPERRREFLDREISTLSLSYYRNLMMYGRILAQRNAYLKEDVRDMDLLAVWDENRIHYGASLIWQRYKFIKKLSDICEKIHHDLTGGKESLLLEYASDCGSETLAAIEKEIQERAAFSKEEEKKYIERIREELRQIAQDTMEVDFKNHHTTRGPQKDDIKVLLQTNVQQTSNQIKPDTTEQKETTDGSEQTNTYKTNMYIDARHFGSQGQQRTAALSMKLSEIELIHEEKGEYPILLLDDVLSELDISRQNYLINALKDVQLFITATELPEQVKEKLPDGKIISIT